MRALSLPLRLLTLSVASAGCSATEIEWEHVEDPRFVAEDGSFALELPLGWRRSERAFTLDGWERQTLTFNAGPVLADSEAGTIDATAPELLLAMQDLLSNQPGIELVECRPATLDGLPGFRLHLREAPGAAAGSGTPARGAEVVLYCAIQDETLYAFSLESRSPETFTRDLEALERLVASFRRLAPAPAAP